MLLLKLKNSGPHNFLNKINRTLCSLSNCKKLEESIKVPKHSFRQKQTQDTLFHSKKFTKIFMPCRYFSTESVSDWKFQTDATNLLQHFLDVIEEAELNQLLSAEYSQGILSLNFSNPQRNLLLSVHLPKKQIWYASSVGGASYFDYDSKGQWKSLDRSEIDF